MKKTKLILLIMIITVMIYLVGCTIGMIGILTSPFTSFPWWTPFALGRHAFVLTFIIELIIYIYFRKKEK